MTKEMVLEMIKRKLNAMYYLSTLPKYRIVHSFLGDTVYLQHLEKDYMGLKEWITIESHEYIKGQPK